MKRLDCLDGLRGLLALTVMLSHLVGSLFGWNNERAFIGAYLSVVYFFMMSGFVLSYSHKQNENFIKYILFRLARLLPLHIISTLIIIVIYKYNKLHGGYFPNEDIFSISTIVKNLFFLNGIYWENFYIINAPSWSVSFEFWCSLLVPILFNKVNFLLKITMSILLSFILINIYPNGFQPSMLLAALSMLVGSICFDLTKNEKFILYLKKPNVKIFIIVSFITCLIGIYSENHSVRDFIYFFIFIPVMFIDFTPKDFILNKILSSQLFVFLGFISFPLYLLHDIIIVSGIIVKENLLLSIALGSLFSIFVAYLYANIDVIIYKNLKRIISSYFS